MSRAPAAPSEAEALLCSTVEASALEQQRRSWRRRLVAAALATLVVAGTATVLRVGRRHGMTTSLPIAMEAESDPNWGCGLVGNIPGINEDGTATEETKQFLDALKKSSTFDRVSFWNWNLAPQSTADGGQILTNDFIFIPEEWGAGAVNPEYVRDAGATNFKDSSGKVCRAVMADLFLGMNEPDIRGSCMGNMFGKCLSPCTEEENTADDCPAAQLDTAEHPPAEPNSQGHCNCWESSMATGVGFWPLDGCPGAQPLPDLWNSPECTEQVLSNWRETAAIVTEKGYRYLTTPLIADDLEYAEKFINAACGCNGDPSACTCVEASCGCPTYVGFHFYAFDCQPEESGGYKNFEQKLAFVTRLMEEYKFLKGAIINEVGMLNCAAPDDGAPICVENSGDFPASDQKDNACPDEGLAKYIAQLFQMIVGAKTKDGKRVVKGFSWFNMNMAGGTYNLELFDENGTVNEAGRAYMQNCEMWGQMQQRT